MTKSKAKRRKKRAYTMSKKRPKTLSYKERIAQNRKRYANEGWENHRTKFFLGNTHCIDVNIDKKTFKDLIIIAREQQRNVAGLFRTIVREALASG